MGENKVIQFKDQLVLQKAKEQKEWFFLLDPHTNCPYVHEGIVDIFAKKELVKRAIANDPMQFQKQLIIKEYKDNNRIMTFGLHIFAYFYYLGLENIRVFYEDAFGVLNREELLPKKDYSMIPEEERPVENPTLRKALNEFLSLARWDRDYEGKIEQLKEKEDSVFSYIKGAKFLIPTKTDGEHVAFAKADNNGRNYLPLFTDWVDFGKAYDKKEWKATVMTIEEASKVAENDAIVINFTAEAMVLPKAVLERMGISNS